MPLTSKIAAAIFATLFLAASVTTAAATVYTAAHLPQQEDRPPLRKVDTSTPATPLTSDFGEK